MKRVLEYLMVFLIVFIASAGTMVMVYKVSSSSEDTGLFAGQDTTTEEVSDPILDGMVASILSTKNIEVELNTKISYKGIEVAVSGTCFVRVAPSIGFALEGEVTYEGKNYPIYVHYDSDQVYVSALGQNVQFSLSKASDGIQPIIEAIKPFLGKIDLSFLKDFGIEVDDLENFDVSSLTSLLSYLKTQETEEGYEVTFAIPEKISATLSLDKNYNITSITLPKTTIADVTLEASIHTQFNQEQFELPSVKEDNYLDVTSAVDLVSMLLGVTNQKTFTFAIQAEVFGYVIDGYASVDFSHELRAQFIGTVAGIQVEILYVDGQLYVSVLGLKLQVTMSELQSILAGYLPTIDFKEIDFASLSIQSFITSITKVEEQLVVTTSQFGTFKVGADESGNLAYVQYEFERIKAAIELVQVSDVSWVEPSGEYTTLDVVQSYVDNIFTILKEKKISGDIALTIDNITILGNVVIYFNEGVKVQLNLHILNKQLYLSYDGTYCYLKIDDVSIKASLPQIVDFVKSQLGIDLTTILPQNSFDLTQIDVASLLQKLTVSVWNDEILKIKYDDITFTIFREDSILQKVEVTYQNILSFALTFQSYEMEQIHKEEYLPLSSVTALVEHVMQLIDEKLVFANVSLRIAETEFLAQILLDAKEELALKVHTTIKGQDIDLVFKDNLISVTVGQTVLQAEPKDIRELLVLLQEQFGVEVGQIVTIFDELFPNGTLTIPSLSLDVKDVLEMLNQLDYHIGLWEEADEYILSVTVSGHDIKLSYTTESMKELAYNKDNLSVVVKLLKDYNDPIMLPTPTATLKEVNALLSKVGSLKEDKKISGNLSLTYDTFSVDAHYVVDFSQMTSLKDFSHLKVQLSTSIYGQNILVTILDGTIYLKVSQLGIFVPFDQIQTLLNWVQTNWGVTLSFDTSSFSNFNLSNLQLLSSEGQLTVSLPNTLSLVIEYQDELKVYASTQKLGIDMTVALAKEEIQLLGDYQPYTLVTNLVDSVMSYVQTKQVALKAKATVFEQEAVKWNVSCALQADLSTKLSFYGFVGLEGVQDMEFSLGYEEEMLYVNYDKLKVKLSKPALFELANMVGQLLGMDLSFLPNIDQMVENDQFDMSNLQQILPSFDTKNPLVMLESLTLIRYEQDSIWVRVDGGKLLGKNIGNIDIQILLQDGQLKGIAINNCYTGVTETERFDLLIELVPFDGVTSISDKEMYMDLSGATGLVKALIHTSSLTSFHITATLDIKMQLLSIKDAITMKLPIDLAISLQSGKPQIMATIGPIPVIAPVDNDVPYVFGDTVKGANPGKNRMLKVYYSDGYVYFYRSEQIPRFAQSDRTYEKMLKITVEEFLSNPLTILSYGCGFQDIVMNEITKAVDKAINRTTPLDMSNILLGFEKIDNTYNLILNLAELANNTDLDTLTLSLSTSLVDNKEYVTHGSLFVHMPIASSFVLDLNSTDLTLDDIGSNLDFSMLNDFISTYPYKVDEKWEASNGEWTLASATVYQVQFESNGGVQVEPVTGAIDTPYTLPVLPEKIVEEGDSKTIYTFSGWYTTSDFAGQPYTKNIITKGDLVLYAKWEEKTKYCTVYYCVDGEIIDQYYGQCGTAIKELNLPERIKVVGKEKYQQVFDCWMDENGDKITLIPYESTTLYARYITIKTNTKYILTYHSFVGQTPDACEYYNEDEVTLPSFEDVIINEEGTTTTYHFEGWYVDHENTKAFDGIMPNHSLELYAKWSVISIVKERKVTIMDNGTIIYDGLHEVGQELILPATIKVDQDTKWYLDSAYTKECTLPSYMPDQAVVLHIRNKYELCITYYALENNEHVQHIDKKWLYQGETYTLPVQESYAIDFYQNGQLSYQMIYTFEGYTNGSENSVGSMPNEPLVITSTYQEQRKAWCRVTFDISWVKPGAWIDKNSAFQGQITCLSAPQTIPSILVLEGETLDLTTYNAYCTYEYKCVWIPDTYNMRVLTWNTTGTKNVLVSKVQNGSYDKLDSLTITTDTTLYATWGMDI